MKKTDWEGFSADLDNNIEEVDTIPENYERFVDMLHMASRKHIPSGCRSNYIPGLTDESKSLYEAYKKQYSIYADDMCVTAEQTSFVEVETTIEESLSELT